MYLISHFSLTAFLLLLHHFLTLNDLFVPVTFHILLFVVPKNNHGQFKASATPPKSNILVPWIEKTTGITIR